MKKILAVPHLMLLLLLACNPGDEPVNDKTAHDDSLARVKQAGVIKWGADVIGGIPYVFEDPKNPGTYTGFEVDIVASIARQLGVRPELVIVAWDNLIPKLQSGTFDMAMNGIEGTEDRSKIVLFSEPYFVYAQQITVRNETQDINRLEDLKGKTVATLSGSAAEDILRNIPEIQLKINPEIIYSYQDLENGKVDAVVLDTIIAAAYGVTNPKLKNTGDPFNKGVYIIAFRQDQIALKDAIDSIIKQMKQSGELRAIYEKWNLMNPQQAEIGIR